MPKGVKEDNKKQEAKVDDTKIQDAKKKDTKKTKEQSNLKGPWAKYVVAIILIIVIIGVAIFAGAILNNKQAPNGNFNVFKQNFDSAPRVNIFVAAYNGTVLSSTIGCGTAVIEEIVGSRTEHRNSSTIDLNIVNQTSCIRSKGLGEETTNVTITTSLQNCLNTTNSEPTLYINYSMTNKTIITPDYLYVSGDATFLRECGVAAQIT
jgi:hypothetical protein